MSEDELTEEDVIRYLEKCNESQEECNESQDTLGFCYKPEMMSEEINEKVKDLIRIFENHKYDTDCLEIETIVNESKFILTEEEFYKVWKELQEIRQEEQWQNYNKSLI